MKIRLKLVSTAIAGSLLLSAVPLASAQSATSAPVAASANVADTLKAVVITAKQVQEKNETFEANLQIPVVSGLQDKKYESKLNASIEEQAMKTLAELKEQSATDKTEADKDGYEFRPYYLDVSYELKADGGSASKGVLSFTVTTYTYTGGAHGSAFVDTYNVSNGAAAQTLTLEKLLGAGAKEKANAAVREELRANPDNYYADSIKTFKSIAADQEFYVSKGVVYVLFQQYDLAPYAAGIIEIPVRSALSLKPSKASKAGSTGYYTTTKGVRMVPLRAAASAFGYQVTWNGKASTVQLARGGKSTKIVLRQNSFSLNETTPVKLSAAPSMVQGIVYVPADFLSRILELKVSLSDQGIMTVSE